MCCMVSFKGFFTVESVLWDKEDNEWDKNASENGDEAKCPLP